MDRSVGTFSSLKAIKFTAFKTESGDPLMVTSLGGGREVIRVS